MKYFIYNKITELNSKEFETLEEAKAEYRLGHWSLDPDNVNICRIDHEKDVIEVVMSGNEVDEEVSMPF